jgi:dTDP-4-dehydrorhamnose reductase
VKVLVTGAAGMLGRAVVARAAGAHDTVGVDLADGDLTDPTVAPALLAAHRPDHVIHCAAYTAVDRAESEPDLAWRVNGDATAHLARACAAGGVVLTYVSTDYVFSGADPAGYAEDDPRDPGSRYGLSKACGEEAVEDLAGSWQIVRTSWLFGDGPVNFVRTIRRLLTERETIRVVVDQCGCPTYAEDLAALLVWLADSGLRGRFHGTNAGVTTWYAFAGEIARASGHDPARVLPCTTADYPTPARRPACSILRDTRLAAAGAPPRPSWQDALRRYLAALERTGSG